MQNKESNFNLLIVGGSQGSAAINKEIPKLAVNWSSTVNLSIRHQTGSTNLQETLMHYEKLGLQIGKNIVVEPFINEQKISLDALLKQECRPCLSGVRPYAGLLSHGAASSARCACEASAAWRR